MRQKISEIKNEVRERTVGYLTAAFGVVAGLAWNDAIATLIEFFFPLQKNTIFAKFVYAIVLTMVVVLVTGYFVRVLQKTDGGN